jgi:hypothetical protein
MGKGRREAARGVSLQISFGQRHPSGRDLHPSRDVRRYFPDQVAGVQPAWARPAILSGRTAIAQAITIRQVLYSAGNTGAAAPGCFGPLQAIRRARASCSGPVGTTARRNPIASRTAHRLLRRGFPSRESIRYRFSRFLSAVSATLLMPLVDSATSLRASKNPSTESSAAALI